MSDYIQVIKVNPTVDFMQGEPGTGIEKVVGETLEDKTKVKITLTDGQEYEFDVLHGDKGEKGDPYTHSEEFTTLANGVNAAAETAQTAKDNALMAATNATSAAKNATNAATNAVNAAGKAEASEKNAKKSAEMAETAKTNAENARTAAETAMNDAVSAKKAAEEARTGAETAKTDAETAKEGAVSAKTEAENVVNGFDTHAEQKKKEIAEAGERVKESIPLDYTNLVEEVSRQSESIVEIKTEMSDVIDTNTLYKEDSVDVTGSGTFVYKDINITDGIVVGDDYTLMIDDIVGATSPHYTYIRCMRNVTDTNTQALANVGTGTASKVKTTIKAVEGTTCIRITLYPATNTPMPTGKATYSNISLVHGTEAEKKINDNIRYDRMTEVEEKVGRVDTEFHSLITSVKGNVEWESESETVEGTGTYIQRIPFSLSDVEVGATYTLLIDKIEITGTATSTSLAYIYCYDANGNRISTTGHTSGTGTKTENAVASLTILPDTASIKVVLYPITSQATGKAVYKGVHLVKGTEIIRDSAMIDVDNINFDKRTLYVGNDCKYKTIQSAVNDARDGDTIVVMEGVYNEYVAVNGATGDIHTSTKDIKIVGFNRDRCILTYDVGDYYKPPLEIARGMVENMTIICTGRVHAEGPSQFAYCVHIDYNPCIDGALQFKNCHFINTVYPCVGIGLRDGFYLSFKDCIFECEESASMLFHEQQESNKKNQHIHFEDCIFISGSSVETIHVQESGTATGNLVDVLFARCIVKNTNGGQLAKRSVYPTGDSSQGSRWLGTRIYELNPMSDLNNDQLFND